MPRVNPSTVLAESVSWYTSLTLALILLLTLCESDKFGDCATEQMEVLPYTPPWCDEIYVVEEGETLHTISEKCGDPYIVENNPHLRDPDDVFPGSLIKITTVENDE